MAPSRTLGATAVLMAARIAGAAMTFAAQVLISRQIGPEALGAFLLLLAAIGVAAVFLPLGFQALAQYFVAEYDSPAGHARQQGFVATGYATIVLTSAILAMALTAAAIGAPVTEAHAMALILVAAGAPAAAFLSLGTGVALAMKQPFLALLPDLVAKPAGILVAALLLAGSGRLSAQAMAIAAGATIWVVMLGQAMGLRQSFRARGIGGHPWADEWRRWWFFAPAWLVIILVGELTIDLDLLLLAALLPPADIGVLGAAMRIFVLVSFALTAVYAVTLPGVFAAGRNDGLADLTDALAQANLVAATVALACFAGTAIFGPIVLGIFGPDFARAQPALLMLVGSLVVRAAFGPAALVLSVFNRPYASIPALLAGLALLVGLNFALTPAYGITGAAAALAIAISFWSIGQWAVALRLTGQNIALRPAALLAVPARLRRRSSA